LFGVCVKYNLREGYRSSVRHFEANLWEEHLFYTQDKVSAGGWVEFHEAKHRNLHSYVDIIRVIRSKFAELLSSGIRPVGCLEYIE
jgi:hypothetical protein